MPEEEPYDEVEEEFDRMPLRAPASEGKGQCPDCGRMIAVRKSSGRLWHHGPNSKRGKRICPGSRGFPAGGGE